MDKKKCKKCLFDKTVDQFYQKFNTCKECSKIVRKKYLLENKDVIRKYLEKNKDSIRTKSKIYLKEYRKKNREKLLKKTRPYSKKYKKDNKDYFKKYKKEYNEKNKEKNKKYVKAYFLKNREKVLKKNRDWNKKYPYIGTWRSILKSHLRRIGKKKEGRTLAILGYSALQLKEHIASLFLPGMSWDNHRLWHVDHKKPISTFDKNTHPSIVNALSNLQPLWAHDNLSKHNNY